MEQGAKVLKAAKKPAKPKTRLSSVANAIRIIKVFSDEEYEIGISDLGKRLSLPKSTVHRLASTLVDAGMLEQNAENGKYRLGLTIFELGSLVRRKMDFSNEAKPYLMELREKTGETVLLSVLEHSSMLVINSLESKYSVRMTVDVGVRRHACYTAGGKALLAFQAVEVIDEIIAEGWEAEADNTITDPAAFRQELAGIRSSGYALDDEEGEIGLRSIAVPIRDHGGNVVAAVSVVGPSQRLTKRILASYVSDVVSAGEAISLRLGYQPLRNARRRA